MFRVIAEDFRPRGPHLVYLRRILDEITRHARSAEPRILYVREHAVQRVPEFVKRGPHIILSEERRFAWRRLRNVEVIRDNRLRPEQIGLRYISIHPRAPVLGWPRVVVADENRQRFSIAIEYFPDAHIWLIHRQVVPLFKREPVFL